MNIKPLNIETIFAGGIHLAWLTLLTLCILGESPDIILKFLVNVESGVAVFLLAIVFTVSFFIGRIAEHFISALNYFIKKENRQKIAENFKRTSGETWGNKIFSFSSFLGLLILEIMLLSLTESWNAKWAIIIIGIILLTATFTSFLFWIIFARRLANIDS